jgi:hypothetical protein
MKEETKMRFIENIRNIAKAKAEASANSAMKEARDYYENHIQKRIEEAARRGFYSCTFNHRLSYFDAVKGMLERDGFAIHAKTVEDRRGCPCTVWTIEW